MSDSETFGVEKGHGEEVVAWLNEHAKSQKTKLEARLYGYTVVTSNFGDFEMFSWIGDVQVARKMIIKASKRFKVKYTTTNYLMSKRSSNGYKSPLELLFFFVINIVFKCI